MSLPEGGPDEQLALFQRRLALRERIGQLSSIIAKATKEQNEVISESIHLSEELNERWYYHQSVHVVPEGQDRCWECKYYDTANVYDQVESESVHLRIFE